MQALIAVIVLLSAGTLVALPLGTLGLLDPLWLTGIYDGGDGDDLLSVAEQGAAASAQPKVRPEPGRPTPSPPPPADLAGGIRSVTAARVLPGAGRDDAPVVLR